MASASSIARRARHVVPTGSWPMAIGVAAFVVVVFGPLAALALDAVARLLADPTLLHLAVPVGRAGLLARSAAMALAVSAGSVAIGALAATVLWRWRHGSAAVARWSVLALAAIPAYVHALAWSRAVYEANALIDATHLPKLPASGPGIAMWVQTMAFLPLATALCLIALEAVPDDLIDAARLSRPDREAFVRVVLPLARPMVLAAAGIVFVLGLLDYSVPALFQVNVYALAVFARYSAGNDPVEALLTAVPLVTVAMTVVVASQGGIRRAGQAPVRRAGGRGTPLARSTWLTVAQAIACVVVVIQIAVPLVSLGRLVGSVESLAGTLVASRSEIATTVTIAVAAAGLCLVPAIAAALGLARGGAAGRLWWLLVTVPLAVPAALVGIGLIGVWNRPELPGVYGSLAMPVLAVMARFVPLAALAVLAQERRVDPLLVDAARVMQRSPLHGWARVRLPLLAPGLLAAMCVTFVLSLGELGATVIVAPPGQQTLTVRIYNYMHYGASDAVAGLCLAMAGVAVAVGAVGLLTLTAWTRSTSQGTGA